MTVRVLVTRAPGSWPKLKARFQGTSVEIRMTATTAQVAPLNARPGAEAIGRLDRYDWLVATSANGVSALLAGLSAAGVTSLPPSLCVAAVGQATAAALTSAHMRVDLVAAESSATGLAASLGPRLGGGARLLVVRPEGAPDAMVLALRDAGATVDEAPLYRTIAAPAAPALADEAIAGAFLAVVFTAPSSFDLWLDAAGARRDALLAALGRMARVAIGPTTAARLILAGLPADAVARTPSEDAVGDAIDQALGR